MIKAMLTLVPMWIPSLIYGLAALFMMWASHRNWQNAQREYQRGYDAGIADAALGRVQIVSVKNGVASSEITLRMCVEIDENGQIH